MKYILGSARRTGPLLAGFVALTLSACDDDGTAPGAMSDIMVDVQSAAFDETDVNVGTDQTVTVEVRNDGEGSLAIESIDLAGDDADDFTIADGSGQVTLGPGEVHEVVLTFQPTSEGAKTARLTIASNDPDDPRVEIPVQGQAARFQYQQVDRMGIPGLNTVFNHPSGVAGFDKTAYNRATPAQDVATYGALFETVLGAVGNADPAATAALLLPDELPVSLGAETAFGSLTGRKLSDDAVDVALTVTVGIAGLQSDNVDANDKVFQAQFPYVAAPHTGP